MPSLDCSVGIASNDGGKRNSDCCLYLDFPIKCPDPATGVFPMPNQNLVHRITNNVLSDVIDSLAYPIFKFIIFVNSIL